MKLSKTYIVAEMACSHEGDAALARKIIDGAGQAEADAIQFQIWSLADMVVPHHPDYEKLNQWQAPDLLVWAVIGSGLLMLFPASATKLLGLNVLLISTTIYFFQGIAIVSFFFEKIQIPRFLKILIYIIIALWQLAWLAVIGIGLFDMWFNFRKLKKIKA